MQKVLFLFFCTIFLLITSMSFAEQSDITGSWVQKLPEQNWKNGHFRYRIFTIWQQGSNTYYSDLQIYPNSQTRSHLSLGTCRINPSTIDQIEHQSATVVHNGKGTPTPFQVEIHESSKTTTETWQFDGKILTLGQNKLENYTSLLRSAHDKKDYLFASDLLYLHIYMIHNQIEAFGRMKMSRYKNEKISGLIDGILTLNFASRGFLGLNNSGVDFYLDNYQSFSGAILNGHFFGGTVSMNGIISLFLDNAMVVSFDFNNISIKRGVANEGYYAVQLAGSDQIHYIPVSRYGD